jgi:ferredoxin-NADP reductase
MVIPGKNSDMTAIETSISSSRLEWQLADVRNVVVETPRVKSLFLRPEGWSGHLAGQHVDIRLTAPDGYQAQRSYSIASAPEDKLLALTVERVVDGEVSPYLLDELRVGDQLELRGPIGGYFVWTSNTRRPLCLIAGGSGVTPLMAMLRHRYKSSDRPGAVLVYSSRGPDEIIFRDELNAMADRDSGFRIVHAVTRVLPKDWMGHRGRIDKSLLATNCFPPTQDPAIFVCGPTPFVENISGLLTELGYDSFSIKTERFGPSGGQTS